MSEEPESPSWLRISMLWLLCNGLAILLYLPLAAVEMLLGATLLPLLLTIAQAYCLRRHVNWVLWVAVTYASWLLAGFALWVSFFAVGCVTPLFQAFCLGRRSLFAALLWFLLGSLGWVAAMSLSVRLNYPPFGWWGGMLLSYGIQTLFLLPAMVALERSAARRTV